MRFIRGLAFVAAIVGIVWLFASRRSTAPEDHGAAAARQDGNQPASAVHEPPAVTRAICVIHPTAGSDVSGVVHFVQVGDSVRVIADVDGLSPGKHGFHIHQYGDCSAPDATSASGHYNPEGRPHGLPPGAERHAGDLGNLDANATGHAHKEMMVGDISIDGTLKPILGRAIIVHAQPDTGGQPTGNAGARLGCGVIGIEESGP
jgi:Cu-Zn family superoxide dismutase